MANNYLLCGHCAKDKNLILFINTNGRPGECSLCLRQRQRVVSPSETANLFKAVVRYHYSEWDYNVRLGGTHLYELLRKENPIIKTEDIAVATIAETGFNFNEFVDQFTSPASPTSNSAEGIWLYKGFDSFSEIDSYEVSLKDRRDPLILDLVEQLANTNYHLLEDRWKTLLADRLRETETRIAAGEQYYRARVGVQKEFTKISEGADSIERVVQPYTDKSIAPPPQWMARAGRLNRNNVAYLYVANSSDTAMAEVRPHPGHIVSIGKYQVDKELRVVDLANVMLLPFAVNESSLNVFVLLKTIERAFATPVLPDDGAGYLATQFLADIIRQLNYDGVTYRSSVALGFNLAAFEPGAFSYVAGSASAKQVLQVEYLSESVVVEMTQDPDATYKDYKRGI